MGIKLIIAGTRSFKDAGLMYKEIAKLQDIKEITEVVSGHARGADQMGEVWAQEHNIKVTLFPVTPFDWNRYGKVAGRLRNKKMADYADEAIVFWDGKSPGTFNMIYEMRHRDKYTTVIQYDNNCTQG